MWCSILPRQAPKMFKEWQVKLIRILMLPQVILWLRNLRKLRQSPYQCQLSASWCYKKIKVLVAVQEISLWNRCWAVDRRLNILRMKSTNGRILSWIRITNSRITHTSKIPKSQAMGPSLTIERELGQMHNWLGQLRPVMLPRHHRLRRGARRDNDTVQSRVPVGLTVALLA